MDFHGAGSERGRCKRRARRPPGRARGGRETTTCGSSTPPSRASRSESTRGVTNHAVTIRGTVTDKDALGSVQASSATASTCGPRCTTDRSACATSTASPGSSGSAWRAADRAGNVGAANTSALIRTAVKLTRLRSHRSGRSLAVTGRVANVAIVRIAALNARGATVRTRVLRIRKAGGFRTVLRLPAKTGRVHVTATAERPPTHHKA